MRRELRAPPPQRLDVVRRDVLQVHHLQVGAPRDVAGDDLNRRQTAAREDMRIDERLGGLLDFVGTVVDRDRLEQHRAVRLEQIRAPRKEVADPLPADRLDHLDRDELVVPAAQVTVVLHQHRDPVLEPRLAHLRNRVRRAARARSSSSSRDTRACAAAYSANPPQPVPISSTRSPGPRSSFSQTRSSFASDASSRRHPLAARTPRTSSMSVGSSIRLNSSLPRS